MATPISRPGFPFAILALMLIWLFVGGCTPPPPGPVDDLPSLEGLVSDPARTAQLSQQLPTPDSDAAPVSLSQILVVYQGVHDAKVRTRWTRAQALERASHLVKLARAKGQAFSSLSIRFSDDTASSEKGGDLGVLSPGMLHPDLEAMAHALKPGQVSDAVETPLGFHILLRQEDTEAQAAEILITYTGAKKFEARVPRSRDEAARLAQAVHARLKAQFPENSQASFIQEAQKYSDRPDYTKGGFMPIFAKGSKHPKFEEIVWNTPINGLSEVVETPTGFHIVGRWPARRIRGRVIKIHFLEESELAALKEGARAGEKLPNSRSQARALIDDARRKVENGEADFVDLAKEYMDPMGEPVLMVEWFGRGETPLVVESVALTLKPFELSPVLEVNGSFFLFKRVP